MGLVEEVLPPVGVWGRKRCVRVVCGDRVVVAELLGRCASSAIWTRRALGTLIILHVVVVHREVLHGCGVVEMAAGPRG